jgi:hypothetical protein
VKKAQGMADMRLISQIQAITFLAFPLEDMDNGERGWHIA